MRHTMRLHPLYQRMRAIAEALKAVDVHPDPTTAVAMFELSLQMFCACGDSVPWADLRVLFDKAQRGELHERIPGVN